MHSANFMCLSPILFAQSDFQEMTPRGRGGQGGGTVTEIAIVIDFIHISVLCKFQLATYSSFCTKWFSRNDPLGQRGWGCGYSHQNRTRPRFHKYLCALRIWASYVVYFLQKVNLKMFLTPRGRVGVGGTVTKIELVWDFININAFCEFEPAT